MREPVSRTEAAKRRLIRPYFYTPAEVAIMLAVSKNKILRMIHAGDIQAVKVGRDFRIHVEAFELYLRGLG